MTASASKKAAARSQRRHDACPICASPALAGLPRFRHAHLVRCRGCSHVFAALIPTDTELAEHYRHYGSKGCTSPLTRSRYDELLDSFEPQRRENRILDFGCGVGDFLMAASERGWEVAGVEMGAASIEACRTRGIRLLEPAAERREQFAGQFDVITAIEVFEHLTFPGNDAAALRGLLRRGGILYLTTPNFAGLARRLLGPRWTLVSYPEHLGYFTPRTLTRLLEMHGLTQADLTTSGLGVGQFRSTQGGAPSRAAAGDEKLRLTLESSEPLRVVKRAINRGLGLTRLGDTIKARYRAV